MTAVAATAGTAVDFSTRVEPVNLKMKGVMLNAVIMFAKKYLYFALVDLTKAFDFVLNKELWWVWVTRGVQEFVSSSRNLRDTPLCGTTWWIT